ncbi:hypothetical protein U1Q18_000954, partial [Sarracenia purpurea var. burkii]
LQKELNETSKLLATTEEELRRCQYELKERDFIISEQKKAGREDKLNVDNRLVVNNFQTELLQQLGSLGNTVTTSVSQQNEQLQCIEKFFHSFLDIHKKVDARLTGLKETVTVNKTFLDGHVSSTESITTDAKRKWLEFSKQAENDEKDSADFSDAKHCRMESLLQQW